MVKKIPLRKCVVTLEQHPKKNLIRVVKNNENKVFIDLTGKQNGRGAYILANYEVLQQCKKRNSLGRALEIDIPDSIYIELEKIVNGK